MSVFICSCCDKYRDVDIHGCEEDTYDPRGISCLCEECAVNRKYDEEEAMNEFRNEKCIIKVLEW